MTPEDKKYPIGGYAPGNYLCHCCDCGNEFRGDKRAVQCEPCATQAVEAYSALSEEERVEVDKRNTELYNQLLEQFKK